jgi:hypothetical protein
MLVGVSRDRFREVPSEYYNYLDFTYFILLMIIDNAKVAP